MASEVASEVHSSPERRIYVQMEWEDQPFKNKITKLIQWMECYQSWRDETGDDVQLIFGFDS